MKPKLLLFLGLLIGLTTLMQAQSTAGTMTFTFTQGSPMYTDDGGCGLAVWIQTGTTFVKTRVRYVGSGIKDHFPNYLVKSGGTPPTGTNKGDALQVACNIVDAITGATRTDAFNPPATNPLPLASYSISWDGKDVAGTIVADGTYTVWYEAAWVDGTRNQSDALQSFTFTKGTAIATTNPANVGPLSAMTLTWTPTALSLDSVYKTKVALYPNPSNGIINVLYNDIPVSKINVVNILGQIVKSIKLDPSKSRTSKTIDLSGNANGLYIINVSTNETSSSYKVILDK